MVERDLPGAMTNPLPARYLDGDMLGPDDAMLAEKRCARHCAVCEGDDHHWIDECDDGGEPIQVCKHCAAWRAALNPDGGA